ncbi:MAG TPA: VOC family protein [Terriglobales bacterium]|nr:VOC family protein [Terriglobales bacterium]
MSGIVAMVRVADVTASASFYQHLGFAVGNAVPREAPPFHWVWLYQPKAPNWKTGANLMLVAEEDPNTGSRAHTVLFYLYARDLKSLRDELLAKGLGAGEISYPEYLRAGEFCLLDPDGYTLMIAQSSSDTP